MSDNNLDLSVNAMKNEQVASLSEKEKNARLDALIQESMLIYQHGVKEMVLKDKQQVSQSCILFSGGDDSTTLIHLFKDVADRVVHINTGIGINQTREYVRETCRFFNLPLNEYEPSPGDDYLSLIDKRGFPGPAQHYLMYQRLKERQLRKARREFREKNKRVVFIAGRRRDESLRRANVPEFDRVGSMVFVTPMLNWTKTDIIQYRKRYSEIPRNPVSAMIHMSGECLCGAFAHAGEREEIRFFFPEVIDYIESLEEKMACRDDIKDECKKWGWGAYRDKIKKSSKVGMLCESCESSDQEQNGDV
jgi:3'-phosphoadenosine 5'-phosphosulfate sulfotransferase (PAPS reductase)/FAD synthetase